MNVAIITAASAALGLSALALQQSGQAPTTPGLPQPGENPPAALGAGAPPAGGDTRLLARYLAGVEGPSLPVQADVVDATLESVLKMLAESQDSRPYIHWSGLEAQPADIIPELPLEGQSLERALEMINDALGLEGGSEIAFRLDGGLFEVASLRFFDRRERELVTYDVSALLEADSPLQVTTESQVLRELITSIVEPDAWPEGGGDVASVFAAGSKLFISAPPRVHERVAWLLAQLMENGEDHAGRAKVLESFVTSMLAQQDPAPHPALLGQLLNGTAGGVPPTPELLLEGTIRNSLTQLTGPWIFMLGHADATELAPIVHGAVERMGGSAEPDPTRNAVVVTGGQRVHAVAAAILQALDRPACDEAAPPAPDEQIPHADEAVTPVSLQLTAEDGLVRAEIASGEQLLRLDASRLQLSVGVIHSLFADGEAVRSAAIDRRGDALTPAGVLPE